MATTTTRNTFLQRLIGAAALDIAIYEEVEADRGATGQALAVVVLSSLAGGLGARGLGGTSPSNIAFISIVALMAWAAWALVTYHVGARLFPEPQTRVDVGELLRTIGFASAPGLLRIFGVLPGVTIPAFAIAAVWMLVAMVARAAGARLHEHRARHRRLRLRLGAGARARRGNRPGLRTKRFLVFDLRFPIYDFDLRCSPIEIVDHR